MQQVHIPAITATYRNFSIHVEPITLENGEILGIFGKSGSGKTSYLKKIREQFASTEVHYMSQYDALLEEITIRQNIELGLACSGRDPKEFEGWEETYKNLLTEFEVNKFLPKLPRQLSGGQRKRTEIVRCLMMDPKILLLDEPFQGIGHLFESVATKYILERAKRKHGATIIVSHDFDLLCKFSKRILLVDDRGVIEFVPTGDPAWKPRGLRTAWTLGVENIIPQENKQYVASWAWMADWEASEKEASMVIPIKRSQILSHRTYLMHGTLYTELQVQRSHAEPPLPMVGQGTVQGTGDASLKLREHWTVTA
jgi:ABC-type nitrate/sulfonate/bicarbonate transport system ATPase subunit